MELEAAASRADVQPGPSWVADMSASLDQDEVESASTRASTTFEVSIAVGCEWLPVLAPTWLANPLWSTLADGEQLPRKSLVSCGSGLGEIIALAPVDRAEARLLEQLGVQMFGEAAEKPIDRSRLFSLDSGAACKRDSIRFC